MLPVRNSASIGRFEIDRALWQRCELLLLAAAAVCGSSVAALGQHWSFKAPVRPIVPRVQRPAWVRNPIDAFILQRLEQRRIGPSSSADRRTLLRRLTYDLTGLPPTPSEIA